MVAKKFLMITYNVHNDLLDAAIKITPGKKSPNITSLNDSNYKAVTCLCSKKDSNAKMDELHLLGATDILTFALSNTRM
jgi:ATP phosphoribosyltransferase